MVVLEARIDLRHHEISPSRSTGGECKEVTISTDQDTVLYLLRPVEIRSTSSFLIAYPTLEMTNDAGRRLRAESESARESAGRAC